MTTKEIMQELSELGNENTKTIWTRHGAREPFYGVKVESLKKIRKITKKDYELSLELYDTGNSDAMYLAGLIAEESRMTKDDLNKWVKNAYWYMLSEYTVAWITAESNYGIELSRKWIESKKENIASSGWATLNNIVSIKADEELDIQELEGYLDRIKTNIHDSQNRVRYTMNGFVISVGCYVAQLTEKAIKTAGEIGTVSVNMGETACKVPNGVEYIEKVKAMGRIGKKRKMARC